MLRQTLTVACEYCGEGGSGERPLCRNLADLRSWADAGDEACATALDARLANWTVAESGLRRVCRSFSR